MRSSQGSTTGGRASLPPGELRGRTGRFVAEMRVDVYQPRHHHQAAPIDGRIGYSGETGADMGDGVIVGQGGYEAKLE